jgi:hypothetical protein
MASLDASPDAPLAGTASSSFLSSASSALQSQGAAVSGQANSYHWWLDVETANTWQPSAAAGWAMNAAVLEGMVQYLWSLGATNVGVYTTGSVWQTVTGDQSVVESAWTGAGNPAPSPLHGVPDWIPGATRQSDAVSNCSLGSFSGGTVVLTQWVQSSLDYDQAC